MKYGTQSIRRTTVGNGMACLLVALGSLVAAAVARADDLAQIDAVLNGCAAVPSSASRVVVIPTVPTGRTTDFTLRFSGAMGPTIGVVAHAVLREGIAKGALKLDDVAYEVTVTPAGGGAALGSYRGRGIGYFDIAAGAGDTRITYTPQEAGRGKPGSGGMTSQDSRCNLMNLVLVGGAN